ncbi:3-oxoacyl-ACP synthase [Changchengzhania lutea]|uniref:3-oxoacyl-ACP synthase n=1 Tax=Changchengzhania lutea TaxID=2049305 RepID=UPI00115DAFCB|nr:3-oxoacyl-ACP synthase [Changchengzhania lutea]
MNIKQQLFNQCSKCLDARYQTIQDTINGIQESLTSETKSSAGDKHETGRAMLQLEREKAGNQLAQVQKEKDILAKIDISCTFQTVGFGSVVYTSKANYFIAISAGKMTVENDAFYAISAETPIAKLLKGHTTGDVLRFRNETFTIASIL